MPTFSFIFEKTVFLRHVVKANSYSEAEEIALEADDREGATFETEYLLSYSKELVDSSASEGIKEIPLVSD